LKNPPHFRGGKWCKDNARFSIHQIFQELFANFFIFLHFRPLKKADSAAIRSSIEEQYFSFADAKVGIIFFRANFFEHFFHFFYNYLKIGVYTYI
jgi:hypothetical protein